MPSASMRYPINLTFRTPKMHFSHLTGRLVDLKWWKTLQRQQTNSASGEPVNSMSSKKRMMPGIPLRKVSIRF